MGRGATYPCLLSAFIVWAKEFVGTKRVKKACKEEEEKIIGNCFIPGNILTL